MAIFKEKVKAKVKNFIMLGLSLNLIIFLHSCASVDKIPESGQYHIIADVRFFAQETYQCGPASLAGVMNYWNIGVTPEEIAREIYSESAKGTLDIDMVIYPQKKGMFAEQYSGGMEDLRKNIDAGHPLITLVDYGFWVVQANHFMVIVGYNEHGVIANSGKEKGKFIAEKDFLKTWERTKFWTLLIKRK
ncbi:MAG: peptidase C39 family protein [Nitrospirae bacterium]|nr:MAG: peptidase C39 family protein [Nitrospirota bacterium]